jgi:kumamolisin
MLCSQHFEKHTHFWSVYMAIRKWLLGLSLSLLCLPVAVQASPLMRLSNSIKAFPASAKVLGTADAQAQVSFHVSLKMRDLDGLRAQVSKGKVFTPEELAAKHFPLEVDYIRLIQWFGDQGLVVTKTYDNRLTVEVKGSVALVRQALGVDFARVQFEGEEFVAARTAPSIPTEFSKIVIGINGLQPYQHANFSSHTLKPVPDSTTVPFAVPYIPKDFLTAYGALNLGFTGTNQRIGIVIDKFPSNSDLQTFWTNTGVTRTGTIERVAISIRAFIPTSIESALDVETSGGAAPGATIRIYGAGSLAFTALDTAYQRMIQDIQNGTTSNLRQMSMSYGACEQDISASQLQTDSQLFATLSGLGVTLFASSGDSGSNNLCNAGIGVGYPASDPSVTAIGGTSLQLSPTDGSVTSETAWSGGSNGSSGGGISSTFARPIWQVGSGVPAGNFRLVPDISLDADPNTGAYIIFRGQASQVGGTSLSSPLFAGFNALLNQARAQSGQAPLGLLSAKIYPLLGTSNLRDITVGTNGAYNAGSGYDLVTGIGVPAVNILKTTLVGP